VAWQKLVIISLASNNRNIHSCIEMTYLLTYSLLIVSKFDQVCCSANIKDRNLQLLSLHSAQGAWKYVSRYILPCVEVPWKTILSRGCSSDARPPTPSHIALCAGRAIASLSLSSVRIWTMRRFNTIDAENRRQTLEEEIEFMKLVHEQVTGDRLAHRYFILIHAIADAWISLANADNFESSNLKQVKIK